MGADIHLGGGEEGDRTAEIHHIAALDPVEDPPLHGLLFIEEADEALPGFFPPRLLAREDDRPLAVFQPLKVDLDRIARLQLFQLACPRELGRRHPPLGLEADIHDHIVAVKSGDPSAQDRALQRLLGQVLF